MVDTAQDLPVDRTGSRAARSTSRSSSCETASSNGRYAVSPASSRRPPPRRRPSRGAPCAVAPEGTGPAGTRAWAGRPAAARPAAGTARTGRRRRGPAEQDAELPAHAVLRVVGAVRVEDVALVEHGVGERPHVLERRHSVGLLEQPGDRLVPRRPWRSRRGTGRARRRCPDRAVATPCPGSAGPSRRARSRPAARR